MPFQTVTPKESDSNSSQSVGEDYNVMGSQQTVTQNENYIGNVLKHAAAFLCIAFLS